MPHKKKPGIAVIISIGKKPKPDMKKYAGDAMPNAMNKAWDVLKISMTDNPESASASSSGTEGFNYGQNPQRCEVCGQAGHNASGCPHLKRHFRNNQYPTENQYRFPRAPVNIPPMNPNTRYQTWGPQYPSSSGTTEQDSNSYYRPQNYGRR